jgi:tape measure domain-containing protein
MSMDTMARLGIFVDSAGAVRGLRQFTGSAHVAGKAGEQLQRNTKTLGIAFRSLAAYFGVRQLTEYADTWTLIHARIRLVTNSTEQAMTVQQRLYEIAQRTRNTMAATSVLYTRMALNVGEMGRSHEELLLAVEAVNAAMLISGATGVEAAQGMRQLAQAMGAGKLTGDEFRTVMEAMPKVAEAIAREFNTTIGGLYKLRDAGVLTTNDVLNALIKAQQRLSKDAEAIPITIGQSITIFTNAAGRMIGIMNTARGVSGMVTKVVVGLAVHMDKLVAAIAAAVAMWVAYKTAAFAAWAITSLWTSAKILTAVLQLAIGIRKVADATALWSLVSKGVVGFLATIAAATVGFYAYKKILEDITAESEKWANAQSDLNEKLGVYTPPVDEEAAALALKTRQQIEDMIRLAHQEIMLSQVQGREQKRLQIVLDAVNKRIEARRTLTGSLLVAMEAAINAERDLLLTAEGFAAGLDEANEKIAEHARIIANFAENVQRSFGDVFYKILNDGIAKFGDLFSAIKQMFFRMLAEMAAAEMMRRWGAKFAAGLAAVFGGASTAAAAVTERVLTAEEIEATVTVGAGGVEEITKAIKLGGRYSAEVTSATLIQLLGPALAGFGVGYGIGQVMPGGRIGGALGGAAGGAAMGALMGSMIGPVGTLTGAVVGGFAGAIGGFLGASKRQTAELERHRAVLAANNKRLQELRESIYGAARGQRLMSALSGVQGLTGTGIKASSMMDFINQLMARFQGMGKLKSIAEELGITLDGSTESYRQLREAIELTIIAITQFGRNLQDVQMKITAYNKLFDIQDSPQQQLMDTYEVLRVMAPELMAKLGIENLDLTTEAGRELLLDALRAIYNMIVSGELTPDLLGAFTDKNQLLDAILKVKDGLDAFHQELYKVTTDFPRAMDIIFYEHKFGKYTAPEIYAAGQTSTQSGSFVVHGGVTIINEGTESGEELLDKLEKAVDQRYARGGTVSLPA